MSNIQQVGDKVLANVERVIVGKHQEVRLALVALMCRGHLLIEDVPGTGKTMLAKAIARSLGCSFRRIQFTPDLLPSDVTGLSIYNQKTQEFEFRPGPIMSQVVLADEINRATPKTQSSLLECMEERQATIDGVSHLMPDPFLVIATQNPIEYEGTFALPEAQLDRFMLRIRLGYPQLLDEIVILDEQKRTHPLEDLSEVFSVDELREMQAGVREDDLRHDRAGLELEFLRLLVVDRQAGDVGWQEVRRELDAPERAAEAAGDRLGEHRLAGARDVLDEEVAPAHQGDQCEPDLLVLAHDHALDVGGHPLGRLLDLGHAASS